MEELYVQLEALTDLELSEVSGYIQGVLRMRRFARVESPGLSAPAKPPRKHSTCSICHQSGHRAPNCKAKPAGDAA